MLIAIHLPSIQVFICFQYIGKRDIRQIGDLIRIHCIIYVLRQCVVYRL